MTLFRAPLLNPISARSWQFFPDGGLLTEDGIVRAMGPFAHIAKISPTEPVTLDGVVLPGFADVHIHWVQHAVRGQFADELLLWLQTHIWPEEMRYADGVFARDRAQRFFADLLAAGTVMGMSYSSPHLGATHTAYTEMQGDWMTGNTIMTVNAPEALTDASAKDSSDIAALYKTLGRAHYALTPRFAINCTAKQLSELGGFARQENLYIQTHLAESMAEVREVRKLFPEATDYTDVYDRAGLLGPQTVLGHCLHLSEREWRCLKAKGAWVAHCPSSNEALDSGRFDIDTCRRHDIPFALASDVGAGPSHSMLHVMQRFLDQHRTCGILLSPQEALYRATLAGADCMGRKAIAGSLNPGKRADFVLMPRSSGTLVPEAWFEELLVGSTTDLEKRALGTWIAAQATKGPPGHAVS